MKPRVLIEHVCSYTPWLLSSELKKVQPINQTEKLPPKTSTTLLRCDICGASLGCTQDKICSKHLFALFCGTLFMSWAFQAPRWIHRLGTIIVCFLLTFQVSFQ